MRKCGGGTSGRSHLCATNLTMTHASRNRMLLTLALFVMLWICDARATSYFVDNATQFNALTDKSGASFATLNAGDRVYLKGGTTWGGIVATITGAMTDAQAQTDPAIVYACDTNYNPVAGGVVIGGVSQVTLAGTGIAFAGVTFGPASGMKQVGAYSDYSPSDANAYLIAMAALSRYMTVSHIQFDHCGTTCTSVNDHSGPWINVSGYHHTIQHCDFQGRDFNTNDINVIDNGYSRTSIHGPTIIFSKDTTDTVDWGFHAVRYNYFGQRLVPDSGDARLYAPADGTVASSMTNGWETMRIGVGALSIYNFNVTVEYNAFYHSIMAVDGQVNENTGEPEMISSKSIQNTIRYNTFLNNYGHVSLRQGDYSVVQGNCFLAGGAYDSGGNVVFTEPLNPRMGGVRVFGFGHTVSNNYFYNISGNSGASFALIVGNGTTSTGTLGSLANTDNGTTTYETANYSQIFNNTFINCNTLTLGNSQYGTNEPYGTQFCNNLIYYGANISGGGITADVVDALSNHGGQAQGNYVFSATAVQLGSASVMLGANNTITSSADPLMTDLFNVLTVPSSNSPLIGTAQTLLAINDTSTTGPSYNLAGNVATQGGIDVRGLARPATGRDIGDFQRSALGAAVRPLLRSEVGIVAATLPNYPVVAESFPGNTRTTQNPPASLTWFCSGVSGNNTPVANGGITLTSNNATRQAVAYFPTQNLNVGDALTLSFNFTVTAPLDAANGLRAGVLLSGATRITSDANANPANYAGTGYGSFINPAPTAPETPVVVAKRGGSDAILTTPVNTPWAVNGTGGVVQSLVAGTSYTATITIRRTGVSQVVTTASYSGGTLTPVSVTATDSAAVITSFDTVALGVGSTAVGSIAYSGVTITKSTPLTGASGSASAVVNHTVNFNLKSLVTSTAGPFVPLTYTVSSPVNGTVSLLSDGVTAQFTPNSNYTGAASFAYSVTDGTNATASSVALNFGSKLAASVILGSLAQTYDGNAKPASYSTNPAALTVNLTYDDGSGATATAPTNAGSYAVTGIINDATYAGIATAMLVISKATASATLGSLAQNYDGTAKTPTVTTVPANLGVVLTYDSGSGPTTTAPSAIGSYTVAATINNVNYSGSTTATLVILPAAASVIFPSNLLYAFDGYPKAVTPTTSPAGLALSVTYNGSTGAPSAIGSYNMIGTITGPNYFGSATATLVIQDPSTPVSSTGMTTWVCPANAAAIQIECWGGGGAGGSAQRTGSSGSVQYGGGGAGGAYVKLVSMSVVPGTTYYLNVGAGGVNNSAVTGTTVAGGDSWFNTVNTPSSTIIAKGGAGGASAIGTTSTTRYGTGGTGSATASAGDVTFAGGSGATATGSGAGGGGSGAGSAAIGASTATNVGATAPTGGGTGGTGTVNNSVSGTSGSQPGGGGGGARDSSNVTIAGGAGGAGKVVITVNKFIAPVVLGNLQQTFDGTPKVVTATTTPTNLGITITYNGSATAPTAAGSYTVVATVADAIYTGSSSGTLVIAAPITSWRQLYFGTTATVGSAADSADPDGDGLTNLQEYTFGTNPSSANTAALLSATRSGANITLTFTALQATGSGYAGLTRHYAIESTTDITTSASWSAVAGYADIVVSNQTLTATVAAAGARSFFRLKAWLQ